MAEGTWYQFKNQQQLREEWQGLNLRTEVRRCQMSHTGSLPDTGVLWVFNLTISFSSLFSLSFSALLSLFLPLPLSPCRVCGLGVRQKEKRRPSSEVGKSPNLAWVRVSLRMTGNDGESDLTAGSQLGGKRHHGWRSVCWKDL